MPRFSIRSGRETLRRDSAIIALGNHLWHGVRDEGLSIEMIVEELPIPGQPLGCSVGQRVARARVFYEFPGSP